MRLGSLRAYYKSGGFGELTKFTNALTVRRAAAWQPKKLAKNAYS